MTQFEVRDLVKTEIEKEINSGKWQDLGPQGGEFIICTGDCYHEKSVHEIIGMVRGLAFYFQPSVEFYVPEGEEDKGYYLRIKLLPRS